MHPPESEFEICKSDLKALPSTLRWPICIAVRDHTVPVCQTQGVRQGPATEGCRVKSAHLFLMLTPTLQKYQMGPSKGKKMWLESLIGNLMGFHSGVRLEAGPGLSFLVLSPLPKKRPLVADKGCGWVSQSPPTWNRFSGASNRLYSIM